MRGPLKGVVGQSGKKMEARLEIGLGSVWDALEGAPRWGRCLVVVAVLVALVVYAVLLFVFIHVSKRYQRVISLMKSKENEGNDTVFASV